MPTTVLLRGQFIVWKNNAYAGNVFADLSYDHDLRFFKIIVNGNIYTSFRPDQVKNIEIHEEGSLFKKWKLGLWAKWPTGDEWAFVFTFDKRGPAENTKVSIETFVEDSKRFDDALRLLKSRERVSAAEVAVVLKVDPGKDDQSVREFVEGAISGGQVEGVFDGKEFVSRYALQRETIRYDIVSKFEVNASGALVITCPKCGAAIPLETKEPNLKCRYCGSPITIPRKILDMV